MKKIQIFVGRVVIIFLPVIILMFNSGIVVGQTTMTDENGEFKSFSYQLLVEVPIWECNIDGSNVNAGTEIAPQNAKFLIIGSKHVPDDFVIIRFLKWKKGSAESAKYNYVNSSSGPNAIKTENTDFKYFKMRQSDFETNAVKIYRQWFPYFTAGTVLIPIKIRFSPFNFSKDFTLGPTAGLKLRLTKFTGNYMNILGSIGVTSVTLDSLSTQGKIKSASDRPAITPSIGCVFEFHNVQIGIFCGFDYISKKENVDWVYQGKPWI